MSSVLTHSQLVTRAEAWLRRQGCRIVLSEFHAYVPTGEKPDNIGWRDGVSILIECKASRSDFLADARKRFRADGGMGDWRFFMAAPGLIRADELPAGWGLLIAHPRKIERVCGGPPGNCHWHSYPAPGNKRAETQYLVSGLRRLQLHHGEPTFSRLLHETYESKQRAPREGDSDGE